MIPMRVFAALALSALALFAAGCGASVSGVARGAELGGDAAALVPADASAYVAADTNLDSTQWQRVDDLTKSFPIRPKILDAISSELQKRGLTWKDDVAPALGSEVDIALLGTSDYVAFAKPSDEAKLRALASKLSEGNEHYTVEDIGGWSVVADSKDLFDKVRAAQGGSSLADTPTFKAAWAAIGGDALARAYVRGSALTAVPKLAQLGGKADWLAARVTASGDALRAELVKHPAGAAPAAKQALLGDVPSGSSLAIAYHGSAALSQALSSAGMGGTLPLTQLAPLLNGDGVLYVRSTGIVPQIAIELAAKNPQAALASARGLLTKVAGGLGPLPLTAQISNGKVVISDGPAAIAALWGGPKLVADGDYKAAVKSAGVPPRTTFVVYANVSELAPFVQLLGQAVGGKAPDPALVDNLTQVDKALAWGSQTGSTARVTLWLRPR
jgi:hypothetical protein